MLTRKAALLDAAVDYLVENGVAKVSLRPMAAAMGTSARLLIFHFQSKERLLQEVFGALQSRLQASFVAMTRADRGPRPEAPIKRYWRWATSPKNLPYFRLLYEVQIIAIQNPTEYARYLEKSSADWLGLSERALSESLRSKAMATLCVAVFDGLFLELLSTGDYRRATRALDRFIALAMPRRTASTKARHMAPTRPDAGR
jgi:AcrR family transcriptional regulator